MFDVCHEISDQLLNISKQIGLFLLADMPMITLAPFVVVPDPCGTALVLVMKPVLEPVWPVY
jgi:hypothetical protein